MKNLIAKEEEVYLEGNSEEVDHFVYLESYMDQERDMRNEVITRIAKAALAFKNFEKM